MRVIAFVQDEAIARRILLHLHLPARAPPRGRPAAGSIRRAEADELDATDWPDQPSAFDGIDPPPGD